MLTNFSDPATQGKTVIFSCSEDLVLTGPDSAACMDIGQWVLDPREVKCEGTMFSCKHYGILTFMMELPQSAQTYTYV